ncbi:MAG TPA: hypothetical protein PKK33_11270, partial [Candidatus Cloacimonadota bacterium]|nr:hypothetical protein [Candidatus Cloacimonadota bacterium]
MEKTFWQIRDSILEALHQYEISDDRVIEPELIEDKILDIRNSIINDEAKSGMVDQGYYQSLDNLEVKFDDISINVSQSVSIDQKHKIGYVDIPSLNTRIGRKAILYFGLPDLSQNFDNKTFQGLIASTHAVYTKKRPCYAVVGSKVFVKNYGCQGARYVSVIAIADDPRKVPGYNFKTSPFPVSDPQ